MHENPTESAMIRNDININGLDLKIDGAVHQICVTSNTTSSSTRSVMYIMVLVNILSLIAVMNTLTNNWTVQRINSSKGKISNYNVRLAVNTTNNVKDSIRLLADSLSWEEIQLKNLVRNKIENIQTVKTPILGNAFDVNNLGIISGITIIVLMSILYVTVKREINNLIIAFNSISERYVPNADDKGETFKVYLAKYEGEEKQTEVLKEINRTRRWHHYFFLSMNEVFNLPPYNKNGNMDIQISEGESIMEGNKQRIKSKIGKIMYSVYKRPIDGIFFIPFIVYATIWVNDFSTIKEGLSINPHHTFISTFCSVIFLISILALSFVCTSKKIRVFELYDNFSKNDCIMHNKSKYETDKGSIKKFIFGLIGLLLLAYIITKCIFLIVK